MTTIVPFTPSPTAPFQFQPTLDGNVYNCVVTWSLSGQRYFLNVSDLSGNLIVAIAMTGSPKDYDISLVEGYFASTLIYRVASQQFEISP